MTRFIITELDLITAPRASSGEQVVLGILKDRGAPVLGTFFLEPDLLNFDWYKEFCPYTGTVIYAVQQRIFYD